jgi:Flp pilus assembly protein TadG
VTAGTWRRLHARRHAEVGRRRSRAGDVGAAAVEFALVVPILLFLVFGIVDFGLAMFSQTMVGNAAREGARTASLEGTQANAEFAVTQALTGIIGTKPGVVADPATATAGFQVKCTKSDGTWCTGWTAAGGGTTPAPAGATVQVTIKYAYKWITPIQIVKGIGSSLTITRQSTMVVE